MSVVSGDGLALCRASIAHHSKSFALASRLLPGDSADEAAVVYAWCRRADDAVDHAPPGSEAAALARLREELDALYRGEELDDPELRAFQGIVFRRHVPRVYPAELLAGMAMDCRGERYRTLDELLTYCYRVAGVVGLMMCSVFELRDASALPRAAHMGIAMQLTNVCRDVLEDWGMGRLYVPSELLAECGAPGLAEQLGGPFPREAAPAMADAVRRLLREADRYYASGDRGLPALGWRTALAVRVARDVYSDIGRRVERAGCDVTAGRAVVPKRRKRALVARALGRALAELPARATRRPARDRETRVLRFPEDVLPVTMEARA